MKLLIVITILITLAKPAFAFEVHAHPGGSSNYSENSLNALTEGLEKGSYAAELDIHLTKDDQFVITHDPIISLKKCSSPIQNEISTLVIRNLLLSQVTSFKCKTGDAPAANITTLEQVLIDSEQFSEQKLNIELKYYNKATRDIYNNHKDELYPNLSSLSPA